MSSGQRLVLEQQTSTLRVPTLNPLRHETLLDVWTEKNRSRSQKTFPGTTKKGDPHRHSEVNTHSKPYWGSWINTVSKRSLLLGQFIDTFHTRSGGERECSEPLILPVPPHRTTCSQTFDSPLLHSSPEGATNKEEVTSVVFHASFADYHDYQT